MRNYNEIMLYLITRHWRIFLISFLLILSCQNERTTMKNGLIIEIIKEGNGIAAEKYSIVTLNYTGKLENGSVFDSSLKPGRDPFRFTLGANQVIEGWDQGILGMKIGEKRRLTIPPGLGYGSRDMGVIPSNSTLIFDVELLVVE